MSSCLSQYNTLLPLLTKYLGSSSLYPGSPAISPRLPASIARRFAVHSARRQHYRDIVWQAECQASRIAEELEIPVKNLDALLSRVDAEIGMQNKRLELELERAKRYRILIDRVNEALSLLKRKPENGV